jgi:hypothetical protein
MISAARAASEPDRSYAFPRGAPARLAGESEPRQALPIAGCAAIGERLLRMGEGCRSGREVQGPGLATNSPVQTSKGLKTERRPGKEEEEVTADEIIVGIDDSPSARGLPLRTPDRPEQRLLHSWVE